MRPPRRPSPPLPYRPAQPATDILSFIDPSRPLCAVAGAVALTGIAAAVFLTSPGTVYMGGV